MRSKLWKTPVKTQKLFTIFSYITCTCCDEHFTYQHARILLFQ